MRIAHIAPLTESVPPRGYGGIERMVAYLIDEMVRQGHQVTLFASGESQTLAELVPCCPQPLGYDPRIKNTIPFYASMLHAIERRAQDFDIIHLHFDFLHFLALQHISVPMLTTLHGWPYLLDLLPFRSACLNQPLVSISLEQRRLLPFLPWIANIYHGLPLDLYPFNPKPSGDYLAFLGRICPEKGLHHAIKIAQLAGMKLRVAGIVKKEDKHYFDHHVAPLMDDPLIEFVGEIGDQEKGNFLGEARALIFPIQWPEPFGLVMIEAMACGTPVIAFPAGSVREVVEHGVTGFISENVAQAADAVQQLYQLDRTTIRERFETQFSVQRMVHDYLSVYEAQIDARRKKAGSSRSLKDCSPDRMPCQSEKATVHGMCGHYENPQYPSDLPVTSRAMAWFQMEVRSGYLYAADRAKNWPVGTRMVFICGAPLIPVVRFYRILKQLYSAGAFGKLSARDMFFAPVGLMVSALGEMAGYVKRRGARWRQK
ncbi:MAG: glycosyltransferase family 4 protein [Pseudomonadota bacterium]